MKRLSIILILATLTSSTTQAQTPLGMSTELWQAALTGTLTDSTDLSFRRDYIQPDSMRLQIVDDAMWQPVGVPGWLARTASQVPQDAFTSVPPYQSLTFEATNSWRLVVEERIDEAYCLKMDEDNIKSHAEGQTNNELFESKKKHVQQYRDQMLTDSVDHISNYSLKYVAHTEVK